MERAQFDLQVEHFELKSCAWAFETEIFEGCRAGLGTRPGYQAYPSSSQCSQKSSQPKKFGPFPALGGSKLSIVLSFLVRDTYLENTKCQIQL